MSLSTVKFMGASVIDVALNLSWGASSAGTAAITLVEDSRQGDSFTGSPSLIKTPVTFSAGSASFRGLLQKYTKNKNSRNGETFEVILIDPREILQSTQLILGGYSGAVSVRNLINVYGFWEAQGFGASGANDGGMPYGQIRGAILQLINGSVGTYGGPLLYRGVNYGIDISEVPNPPAGYRFANSGYVSLFDFIAQICDDGGHDFYVTLVDNIIKIKTQSRITSPPLGTITTFIEANENSNLISSKAGVEGRSSESTRFLVGGQQQALNVNGTLKSYWGNDINGNPVFGQSSRDVLVDSEGSILASIESETATVNAAPVADILNSLTYTINEVELRAALIDQSNWASYLENHKRDIAARIGLGAFNWNPDAPGGAGVEWISGRNNRRIDPTANYDDAANQNRLYDFVHGLATKFYGRKYAVEIPGVSIKIDPDTLVRTYSHEPTDGGWYEGLPLGVPANEQDVFQLPDGRYSSFVKYVGLNSGVDYRGFSPQDTVWETESFTLNGEINSMYAKCNLDRDQVIFHNNKPYVLIELPGHMQHKFTNLMGDNLEWLYGYMRSGPNEEIVQQIRNVIPNPGFMGLLPWIGQQATIQAREALERERARNALGNLPFQLHPRKLHPSGVAIPLKSNILTYGPWQINNGNGSQVRYEQDSSLTPWNYGSEEAMELAALAKLTAAATETEVIESGEVEQEGLPLFNIGETMIANGPNITNINISFRTNGGASTTYRFESFTPRRGNLFNNNLPDNIRRLGQSSQNIRRELRAFANEQSLRLQVATEAANTRLNPLPEPLNPRSPHPMIVSHAFNDDSGNLHIGTSLMTRGEANVACALQTEAGYRQMAAMDFAGIFVPVSTANSGDITPYSSVNNSYIEVRSSNLNTFQNWGIDIVKPVEWISVGSSYSGLSTYNTHIKDRIAQGDDVRFVTHRSPLILCGWGYNLSGQIIGKDAHPDTYHHNLTQWKAGPVDLLWDEYRGMWTPHGFIRCVAQSALSLSGDVVAHILDKDGVARSEWPIRVTSDYNTTVGSGDRMAACFDGYSGKWYVIAADC